MGVVTIWKEFSFEAAHSIPEAGAENARIHGHSYMARVYWTGKLDANGMVRNMVDVGSAVAKVRGELDHINLNDITRTPTLEFLAAFIADKIGASKVDVWRPTCGDGASWEASQ